MDETSSAVEKPRFVVDGFEPLTLESDPDAPATQTVQMQLKNGQAGTLSYGKYSLYVPAGTVKKPTTFQMVVATSGTLKVSLSAWESSGKAVSQFPNGLRLTLPYDQVATTVTDPNNLVIAYVTQNADGSLNVLEVLRGVADTGNLTVTGTITHFSDYILGQL